MFQPAIQVHKELKTKIMIATSVMGQSEMSVFGVNAIFVSTDYLKQ
jgi:hypothetical protein